MIFKGREYTQEDVEEAYRKLNSFAEHLKKEAKQGNPMAQYLRDEGYGFAMELGAVAIWRQLIDVAPGEGDPHD